MNVYEINDAWNNQWNIKMKNKENLNENEFQNKNEFQNENDIYILDIGFMKIIKIYFTEYFNFFLSIIILLFIFLLMKLKY